MYSGRAMNQPEIIWVAGMPFDVYFDHTKLATTLMEADGPPAVGASSSDKLEIIVDDRLPIPRQRDVLLHETLHCIWSFTSIRNATDASEEMVVDAIATALVYVLRVNPDLVGFLITGSPSETSENLIKLEIQRVFEEDSGGGEDTQDGEGET